MTPPHPPWNVATWVLRCLLLATVTSAAGCAVRSTGSRQTASTSSSPADDVAATPAARNGAAATAVVQSGRGESASTVVSMADLDRRTAELFGESLRQSVTVPMRLESDSFDLPPENQPTWDIDVRSYENVDRVRHYVALFTGRSRDYFVERLSRGTRYEAMIRAKLRAGDLPEDLYYLALIESGYDPHAYSRAAAVGMWQFMTTTARGVGLRVDWWVDERRDPVRSTEAAVRFLRGLNEQFGSLYLAAAAYNGGPSRVARGLDRYADELEGSSADEMFFTLAEKKYLRNETREYVPQLIAAALVAKERDRYGIVLDERPPFDYDSVSAPPRMPLAVVAEASGTTVSAIRDLNPHILRGITPPNRKDTTVVRIPVGTRERYDSVMATLPPERLVGANTITAPKGATWASIGRKHGVSARAVSNFNPKVKASRNTGTIAVGTSLLVPTPAAVVAAVWVPDPAVERYGVGTRIHVVRKGENLSVIAKRYKTTPTAIMRLNRLRKALIFPGQELRVRP